MKPENLRELTRAEAEDFLYREARLLDERRFEEWLALFTHDGRYWVPCGTGQESSPVTHLVYDDRAQLEDRVWQLQHPRHSSQNPSSQTTHLVSNVEVGGADGSPALRSSFVVYELRRTQTGQGEPRPFVGRCEHLLRWEDGGWRIVEKKIWLISRDLPIANLTFLL